MATKTISAPRMPDVRHSPTIDQVGIEERVARIKTRSIKKEAKVQGMKLALSMIDLTTLEGADTPGKVQQLCYKAMHPHDALPDLPMCAAICVYPSLVKVAKKALGDSGVKVASVSTAFPSGQAPKNVKIADTRFAVNEGADEIDMVISRGHFHSGDYNFVFDEIAAIKEACGDARLKVILETGELGTYDKVRLASDIAIAAGADFIKTSTGKINPAATMEVTLVMLHAIRDHYLRTGRMIAMKPAGGIRKSKEALHYLMMVKEELGEEWLSNHWFRFGASSLANDILMQLAKESDGHYQSGDYFSLD
ncbi:MAG TPA: deoxyribose-phosphate aldolase [Flavobacteriales bacterium]|nr:deoxyribose-phosphate aldolase [Flavobacteriales bacterium]